MSDHASPAVRELAEILEGTPSNLQRAQLLRLVCRLERERDDAVRAARQRPCAGGGER